MKPLSQTNPYLKDPELRNKLVNRTVITSSGVEGVKLPESFPYIEIVKLKNKKTERPK